MTISTYQVRVRDTSGAQVAVFGGGGRGGLGGGLVSFSYTKRLRLPGQWSEQIEGNDERIADLMINPDTGEHTDYVFEFWRRDVIGGLDWYRDFEGFHRGDSFSLAQDGRQVYVPRGRGLDDLIPAEIIAYSAGTAFVRKSGAAETVAKAYVEENIGPSATVAAGRRYEGAFQGLTVQVDGLTGDTWSDSKPNKNLLDVLDGIAEAGPGDFMIVLTSDTPDAITMEFRWKDNQWGLDRTEGNGVNDPVIWDTSLNNIQVLNYTYSRLDEVNLASIGGPGVGTARAYTQRTSGTELDSPWARRSVFRKATSAHTVTERETKADSILNKQRAKRMFSFSVMQTDAIRYGVNWDLGDLVTVKFKGYTFTQKITGVRVSLSQDGTETIQPETEDL